MRSNIVAYVQDRGRLVSHAMPGQTTADCLTCLIRVLKRQLRKVREQLRRFQVCTFKAVQ